MSDRVVVLTCSCGDPRSGCRAVDCRLSSRDYSDYVSERPADGRVTREQRIALTTRADLLAEEAALVVEQRITWAGRLAQLGDYGTRGGSAADRRQIIEAMASLEA